MNREAPRDLPRDTMAIEQDEGRTNLRPLSICSCTSLARLGTAAILRTALRLAAKSKNQKQKSRARARLSVVPTRRDPRAKAESQKQQQRPKSQSRSALPHFVTFITWRKSRATFARLPH